MKLKKTNHYDDANAVAKNMSKAEIKTESYNSSKLKSASDNYIYF